jgi:hypothetical protein
MPWLGLEGKAKRQEEVGVPCRFALSNALGARLAAHERNSDELYENAQDTE